MNRGNDFKFVRLPSTLIFGICKFLLGVFRMSIDGRKSKEATPSDFQV